MDTRLLQERLAQVNVPSVDNGYKFLVRERLDAIHRLLEPSVYALSEHRLAQLYTHRDYVEKAPFVLLSVHIDACYQRYFAEVCGDEWLGTFDNSLCNAICLQLMLEEAFPPNVMIVWTGDEESNSRGVDDCFALLREKGLARALECVLILDVTPEGFGKAHIALENFFCRTESEERSTRAKARQPLLSFAKRAGWVRYLAMQSARISPLLLNRQEAEPDDSWQYDEYNLNCVSCCLPCAPHPQESAHADWMHSDKGIRVQEAAIHGYLEALPTLVSGIANDLLVRATTQAI